MHARTRGHQQAYIPVLRDQVRVNNLPRLAVELHPHLERRGAPHLRARVLAVQNASER